MHRLKTGALLHASVLMGAACKEGVDAQAWQALSDYGQALGVAFQVVDDILDVVADSATLARRAGKDAANDKPTYVSLLGLDQARAMPMSCAPWRTRRLRAAACRTRGPWRHWPTWS